MLPVFHFCLSNVFRPATPNWIGPASDKSLNLPPYITVSNFILYSLYHLSSSSNFVQANHSEHFRFITHCNSASDSCSVTLSFLAHQNLYSRIGYKTSIYFCLSINTEAKHYIILYLKLVQNL